MSRDNKLHTRDLKQQIHVKMYGMLRAGIGTSKKNDKLMGTDCDKIYSYETYHAYKRHCDYFANYIREAHPECKSLEQAKQYVTEWLEKRTKEVTKAGKPLSAYTITLERQALSKLYGIKPEDPDFFETPKRLRMNITRSRGVVKRDKHFSEKNNDEFIRFCRGTGCRRKILKKLEGRDYKTRQELLEEREILENKSYLRDDEMKHLAALRDIDMFEGVDDFLHHRSDKGGKERYAPIIGPDTELIVRRMTSVDPTEKVWLQVSGNADIHSYRSDYANRIYRMYARPIDEIPKDAYHSGIKQAYARDVYSCRKDETGKKLDKRAMEICSKALGHNRISVIADHYLRGL